jgi:F420H(2)-dependent quinone reductase
MTDQQNYNHQLIEEFRANRHSAGGPFAGRPLLLLTTTGARSGKRRTTPMMYIPDGERLQRRCTSSSRLVSQSGGSPTRHRGSWDQDLRRHCRGDGGGGATAAVDKDREVIPLFR